MGGGFNFRGSSLTIAYGEVDAGGTLQAGSTGISNVILAGIGDYSVTFTPGFFSSTPVGWVNALSDGIGSPFGFSTSGCSVQTLDPAAGANANRAFYIFVIQL